jgi:hypothetical protein
MDVFYFLRENVAKIMITMGFALLILGVLTLTAFFTVIPLLSLSLGLTLLAFGFFSRMGLFSIEWRSTNGVAMMLLCVSVAFFALAVASIQFQELTTVQVAPVRFDGSANYPTGLIHEKSFILNTDRPFLSLFVLAIQGGLASFFVSLAVTGYSRLRSIM